MNWDFKDLSKGTEWWIARVTSVRRVRVDFRGHCKTFVGCGSVWLIFRLGAVYIVCFAVQEHELQIDIRFRFVDLLIGFRWKGSFYFEIKKGYEVVDYVWHFERKISLKENLIQSVHLFEVRLTNQRSKISTYRVFVRIKLCHKCNNFIIFVT